MTSTVNRLWPRRCRPAVPGGDPRFPEEARDSYARHTPKAGGAQRAAVFGDETTDETTDEASRGMGRVVSGKGRTAGMTRTDKFEIPEV